MSIGINILILTYIPPHTTRRWVPPGHTPTPLKGTAKLNLNRSGAPPQYQRRQGEGTHPTPSGLTTKLAWQMAPPQRENLNRSPHRRRPPQGSPSWPSGPRDGGTPHHDEATPPLPPEPGGDGGGGSGGGGRGGPTPPPPPEPPDDDDNNGDNISRTPHAPSGTHHLLIEVERQVVKPLPHTPDMTGGNCPPSTRRELLQGSPPPLISTMISGDEFAGESEGPSKG